MGLRIGYRGARGMPRIPGASLSVRLSCSHQYPCLQILSLGLPFCETLFTLGGRNVVVWGTPVLIPVIS